MRSPARQMLSDFVRACRERTSPEAVGLSPARRRRTSGLRCEEVAAIAGVGVTWYTWFEQGRDIAVSDDFLFRLVRGLRLDRAEKEHLFALAGRTIIFDAEDAEVPRSLGNIIHSLRQPAYVMNSAWDVLAYNKAAVALFEDLDSKRPNMLRLVFFSDRYRQQIKDWRYAARLVLLKARHDYLTRGKSPVLRFILDDILLDIPEAKEWWDETEVMRIGDTDITFRNALGEDDVYPLSILVSEEHEGIRVVFYDRLQPH
ncbi:helix-turn-helix transcriptional regulator [Xanthomonas vesicatoria]|uniref:helix-turn-helix transcriptional regulator n=1 Tax=Xanthomonas vesicatoria TaxID=56460 RepID=UPI0013DE973B|nr:helix-turn-helix transcriptional regulator [Xanthomonas vesicatoria]MCC8557816.1 helix-turn-helix transcriptional regulator [Xanthomonas vesicatoria]MCC8601726.1 helix-turn-helix transcriptional regulator [Xanthomonas vesicatoria]MCC8607864.1 helix-turn-helix transcriptional regulator [Xanthomonas vesicatoria]MCC8675843.1 helix-turn-helix transcriptional regulator [Xanthomonas vesicatoria]MCC8677864.1 helix-turn-helix transcriptional regulator [Xanthomonas vesicatoria]